MTRSRPDDLLVFVGPSLPAAEAVRIAPCRVLPPARAGDLFAVLPLRPLAIALLDGVFELVPSVWHREILAALDAGIAVFGGASMGALRAVELAAFGMVGVGGIFRAYRDGDLSDDSEVALLHAGPEHGHRPFTVPLVAVRAAARAARRERRITGAEARAVVAAAERVFWQERTWPAVLDGSRLGARARARLEAFLPRAPDPKAADARACLAAAAGFVRARRSGAPPPPRPA
ncbi:MAG TPA: TfuA-like protein, partial [Anaeromyxobacteraceae bacterium]|nr:TfuA-like protein [Anaeromyxobacteraceae bacterium]